MYVCKASLNVLLGPQQSATSPFMTKKQIGCLRHRASFLGNSVQFYSIQKTVLIPEEPFLKLEHSPGLLECSPLLWPCETWTMHLHASPLPPPPLQTCAHEVRPLLAHISHTRTAHTRAHTLKITYRANLDTHTKTAPLNTVYYLHKHTHACQHTLTHRPTPTLIRNTRGCV